METMTRELEELHDTLINWRDGLFMFRDKHPKMERLRDLLYEAAEIITDIQLESEAD